MAGKEPTKYIFVTGGVLSGLGKGIAAASLGHIFKRSGLSVNIQKCDPYLNVDAGTLNPGEHGEVFVTKDGAEADLDLGHYERFLDQELTSLSTLMNGRVMSEVINDERSGKYLGKTVQIIPHVTNKIQEKIIEAGEGFDVHIVEIGGTVGDYESLAFFEAIRELQFQVGTENVAYVHVVFLPYLAASEEIKTKPAQNATRELRSLGITPDALVARADQEIPKRIITKLSLFCGVDPQGIALLPTVDSIYEVPFNVRNSGIDEYLLQRLGVEAEEPNLDGWRTFVDKIHNASGKTVSIGMIAKYMDHADTYMSVTEAISAAAWKSDLQVNIEWIDSEEIEDDKKRQKQLGGLDGIIVPGGFGSRGIEGKIAASKYALENNIPYLGLCLGMQVAVVNAVRNVLGTEEVNSFEVDEDVKHPAIHLMASQEEITKKGGTMRLGNYECVFEKDSKASELYGEESVQERHRHRYEVNNNYRDELKEAGFLLSGKSPDGKLVEVIEHTKHPFYMGCQFHPEFKSRPDRPHPLFEGFMEAVKTSLQTSESQVSLKV